MRSLRRTMFRKLGLSALILIALGILLPISPAAAQQPPCAATDGFSYANYSSNWFGPATWSEFAPPIYMPKDTVITFAISGAGTYRLRWFTYPAMATVFDTGTVAMPGNVSFTAPETGGYQ